MCPEKKIPKYFFNIFYKTLATFGIAYRFLNIFCCKIIQMFVFPPQLNDVSTLHYLVKMIIGHMLRLRCYRKKPQNLFNLNCGHQIWTQLITACGCIARQGVQKYASLIWMNSKSDWEPLLHPALKSAVSAPWHNFQLCPSSQQILATPLHIRLQFWKPQILTPAEPLMSDDTEASFLVPAAAKDSISWCVNHVFIICQSCVR